VARGDQATALSVNSLTATGTDVNGNAIATALPSSGGGLGQTLVIVGIAPATPTSFELSSISDTGTQGDYITVVTQPSFDFKGLVVGGTVSIYEDTRRLQTFKVISPEMRVQLASALTVGAHAKLHITQTDAVGNVSDPLQLGGGAGNILQISNPASTPAALTGLDFDNYIDGLTAPQYQQYLAWKTNPSLPKPTGNPSLRDYITFVSTPTFNFTGGKGRLTLNGAAVTVNQVIAAADLTKLVYTPEADGNGDGHAHISFKVQDSGGTLNGGKDTSEVANTLTFNVASVNDAPTTGDSVVTFNQGETYTLKLADIRFADEADARGTSGANYLQSLVLTSLPQAGTLVVNGVALTSATGKTISANDIAAGHVTFTPAPGTYSHGATPYASLSFQVQDDGGTADGGKNTSVANGSVGFIVNHINSAPQGAITVTGITAGHAPEVGQLLTATSNITDADGIPADGSGKLLYHWSADGVEIASTAQLLLTNDLVGKTITVRAQYTDQGGAVETVQGPTISDQKVAWPTSISLSGLSFLSLDPANTTPVAATQAKLISGHDGNYLLDVNGDGVITADDRTSFARGLDSSGSITIGHLKLTMPTLNAAMWGNVGIGRSYADWPTAEIKGSRDPATNTLTDGNDYWTSTAGVGTTLPSHQVYNSATASYAAINDAVAASPLRLHYNAFQVMAV